MRTTFELDDKTFRRAKLAAVSRGISMKKLIEEGIELVLKGGRSEPKKSRIKLPLLGSKKAGVLHLPVDIDFQTQQAEDLARYAISARR